MKPSKVVPPLVCLLSIVGCSGERFGSRNLEEGLDASSDSASPETHGNGGRAAAGTGGARNAGGSSGTTGDGGRSGGTGGAKPSSGGESGIAEGGVIVPEGGVIVPEGGVIVPAEGGVISGPRWCAGRPGLFCEDFDAPLAIDQFLDTWTSSSHISGTYAFDTSNGVPSRPNALRVRSTSDFNVNTVLVKTLPPFAKAPNKIRLEFALRIDSADGIGPASGAVFASIITGAKPNAGYVGMEVAEGPVLGVGYYDPPNDESKDSRTSTLPATNQWLGTYAVEIVYSGSGSARTGCAQAYAGGAPVLASCLKLPASLLDPEFVSVGIGVLSVGLLLSGDVQVRFDNVLLTTQ